MITLSILVLLSLGVAFFRSFQWKRSRQIHALNHSTDVKTRPSDNDDVHIVPLPDFDFRKTDPIRYRPFETKQHVAMGIKEMPKTEWIRIDKGYLSRLAERKQVMEAHSYEAIGDGPLVNSAIEELYQEIMIDYLPKRFPNMFQITGKTFHNHVTGDSCSVDMAKLDHSTMLRNLGENVEEDFYFMCPDEHDEIRLRGYIACFPGGFLSPGTLGKSMREIHAPVPGFAERIAKGSDKFLARLQPGRFVERYNWSLQIDGPGLFRMDGNNFYPEKGHVIPDEKERILIDQCWLRVEHQTLCRLTKSRAVIFCVRSYMTALHDIKAEGNGPLLAEAFESMPEKLGDYKKRPFWSEEVYAYLRS